MELVESIMFLQVVPKIYNTLNEWYYWMKFLK